MHFRSRFFGCSTLPPSGIKLKPLTEQASNNMKNSSPDSSATTNLSPDEAALKRVGICQADSPMANVVSPPGSRELPRFCNNVIYSELPPRLESNPPPPKSLYSL